VRVSWLSWAADEWQIRRQIRQTLRAASRTPVASRATDIADLHEHARRVQELHEELARHRLSAWAARHPEQNAVLRESWQRTFDAMVEDDLKNAAVNFSRREAGEPGLEDAEARECLVPFELSLVRRADLRGSDGVAIDGVIVCQGK
jgi:hypothetical protein